MLLSDVRVIDATNRFGWLAGRVLADLGAKVIKVDAQGTDRQRPEWRAFNVNKRVVDLDLTKPTDEVRFEQLIATADICLLTTQANSRGQIDPDELRRQCPQLIVVVVTPFGSTGPRSDWKGTDIEAMAAGGAMALAGEPTGPQCRSANRKATHGRERRRRSVRLLRCASGRLLVAASAWMCPRKRPWSPHFRTCLRSSTSSGLSRRAPALS
jgi:crotonobetainyl-CoA:carnitine CoA-transferase CaiB-like acyl-CoA transferase